MRSDLGLDAAAPAEHVHGVLVSTMTSFLKPSEALAAKANGHKLADGPSVVCSLLVCPSWPTPAGFPLSLFLLEYPLCWVA